MADFYFLETLKSVLASSSNHYCYITKCGGVRQRMYGQSGLQINCTYRQNSIFRYSYKNKTEQLKQLE